MWPPSTLLAASVALLFTSLVAGAQRTSPQFTFPTPGNQAQGSQFGADLFGANNQDLSLLSASGQPQSSQNSAGPQSTFVALGAPQSSSSPLGPLMPEPQFAPPPALLPNRDNQQLVAQSPSQLQQSQPPQTLSQQQQQQPQQQQQQQNQQPSTQSIQLSRPSLSLTSLSLAQQPQQQPSARSSSLVSQQPQTSAAAGTHHQSARHHHQHQQQPSTSSSSSSSRSVSSAGNHQASSTSVSSSTQQRPSQQQPAAAERPHSVESARKFEATSASLAASSGQTFNCPDTFGFFRHHKSCDKYWACENGTATLKLCGNGLMFDDSDPKRENCAYPFSVDCGADRTDLEPPISTPNCPRLYGLFSDNSNCRVFYSCWNGEASKYECPPGLAYDAEQRVCVWADLVDRCDQSEVSDGFVCPDPTEADQPGHYTRHPHVTDCRKFYVCIEGVARPYGCSFGTVFNVDSLQCDEPENVSGCEKYYGDLDPKLAKKLARENAQGNPGNSSPASRSSSTSSSSSSSTPKET